MRCSGRPLRSVRREWWRTPGRSTRALRGDPSPPRPPKRRTPPLPKRAPTLLRRPRPPALRIRPMRYAPSTPRHPRLRHPPHPPLPTPPPPLKNRNPIVTFRPPARLRKRAPPPRRDRPRARLTPPMRRALALSPTTAVRLTPTVPLTRRVRIRLTPRVRGVRRPGPTTAMWLTPAVPLARRVPLAPRALSLARLATPPMALVFTGPVRLVPMARRARVTLRLLGRRVRPMLRARLPPTRPVPRMWWTLGRPKATTLPVRRARLAPAPVLPVRRVPLARLDPVVPRALTIPARGVPTRGRPLVSVLTPIRLSSVDGP